MHKNSIQFQKGFSIPEFMQMYGTEMQCKERLFHLRPTVGLKAIVNLNHGHYINVISVTIRRL
jgi:hypothetical protein